MGIPRPGRRVRGSRTGRPVMALLDLLGRRMTLRVLWELSRSGEPLTFRALQGAADTNPALLNTRLKELRAARPTRSARRVAPCSGGCCRLANGPSDGPRGRNDREERWSPPAASRKRL